MIWLSVWMPLVLSAQSMSFSSASTPDVRKGRQWVKTETEHFDIWFNPSERALGEQVGRYAEFHMRDLCHSLDYQPKSRFVLHVYPTPEQFWHSPHYINPDGLAQGGVTKLDGNAAAVFYHSGQQDVYRRVREAVCKVLMNEIYFGLTVQFSMQQQMMLDLPEWFRLGIPAFEGEGWTEADDARMRSLSAKSYVHFAAYDHDPDMSRTLQKSVWFYISRRFSPVKVYSVMYMTRVSRSVQSGIITVLGVGMETFTDRWREFYVQRYQSDLGTRRTLAKEMREVKAVSANWRQVQAVMDGKGQNIAAVGERKGRYRLFITRLQDGKQKSYDLPGGMASRYQEVSRIPVPLAWNHDDTQLLMILSAGVKPLMVSFEMSTSRIQQASLPGSLDQIHGIDWKHEKGWLVIAGIRKGQADLFIRNPAGNIVQLTNDLYDVYHPVWSKDEQSIYFASNRRTQDSLGVFAVDAVRRDLDIFRYQLSDDSIYSVTSAPNTDEWPLFQPSSFELVYMTSESGIAGMARRNVFTQDSFQLTTYDAGLISAYAQGNRVQVNIWNGGRQKSYWADNVNMTKGIRAQPTELSKEKQKEYEAIQEQIRLKSVRDSVIPVKTDTGDLIRVEVVDHADPGEKKQLKYYLFDEEDTPRKPTENQPGRGVGNAPSARISNVPKVQEEKKIPSNWSEIELKSPKNPSLKRTWFLKELGSGMAFDPLFRYHLDFYAVVSDIHKYHTLVMGYRPYLSFRSSDFYVRWEYRKHRLQPGASFDRYNRFYNKENFELRYTIHRYQAWLGYSFNRHLRLTGGARFEALWRSDLSIPAGTRYPDQLMIPGAFMHLDWDKTLRRENAIISGSRAGIHVDNYMVTGERRSDPLSMIHLDGRKYIRVLKESTLALRVSGGFSLGAVKPLVMLGGLDNWVTARFQNVYEMQVPAPTEGLHLLRFATPIRGFAYNARNGTQFVAFNGEFRFPILRYLTRSLHTHPLYNFQLVAFYDIGTVWTQGNPLSQRNPVNSSIIEKNPFLITVQSLKSPFIAGAGGGFRMAVMRYILRFDVAIGIEDGSEAKPQFAISLGKDF
jgi:hypothetical protein